jgi:hypothetical protein
MSRRECLTTIGLFTVVSGCKYSPGASLPPPARAIDQAPQKKKVAPDGGMAPLQTFTPENFGAAGDGQTNDTDAFARMAAAVNASGGGTILLRQTTYIVGGHVPDPTLVYAYGPAPVLDLNGCSKAVMIVGSGARLRCADGLRFGTFDPVTGLPTQHSMPYVGTGELASPYVAMITVQNSTGKVSIENLELDGNIANLIIGGPYGDTGWQIPAYGLRLVNNSGGEHIVAVHSHHQPVDGILIDGAAQRDTGSLLEAVVSEYNVRQGCSIIGGRNYSFANCKFNHTGKAGMVSAPGAGFDIEAESSPIRNLSFRNCEFSNNTGPGMGADSGDSEGAIFQGCQFVGTTNWAAWPRKPLFRFEDCAFVGSICNTYGDPDPSRAAQFHNCSFRDDPALSPTGEIYSPDFPIADLSNYANVLFDSCTFCVTHEEVLPWSMNVIYKDSSMSQAASKQAYPRGTYVGTNRIEGNVDLTGSQVLGDLTVNGQLIPRTS